MERRTSCTIGAPISTNDLYVPIAFGKMVKSRRYRAWIEKNLPIVRAGMDPAERFPLRVEITIVGGRDWNDGHDVDNSSKAILDILTRAGIIPDDKGKYVEMAAPRYMPWGRRSEALTRIEYLEPEEAEGAWELPAYAALNSQATPSG